jgi:hypothetical protein
MKINAIGKVRIGAEIDYYDDGVLTFDPEKVLVKLKHYFDNVKVDLTDYSRQRLEKIIKIEKERGQELNHSDVIKQMLANNRRNGPIFRFKIQHRDDAKIIGSVQRYAITFRSEQKIDNLMEQKIVAFLKSIEYGEIYSFENTSLFCKKSRNIKGKWLLS